MAYDCSLEEERLQKKLVPLNIVVCVLCMIAIISLLVSPLFTINVGDMMRAVGQGVEDMGNENGSSSSEEESDIDIIGALEGVDLVISFTPITMGQVAFSGTESLTKLVDEIFVKTGMFENMLVPMVNAQFLENFNATGSYSDSDLDVLNAKFKAIGNVQSEAEFKTAVGAWLDEFNNLEPGLIGETERDAAVDQMVGYYAKTLEETGGAYDLEKLVCVIASDGMGTETIYTSYTQFIMEAMSSSSEGGDLTGDFNELLGAGAGGIFGFVMFTVGVWFVLFLFSLLHIFAQNKRFMMWYVKLWGALPCFLFGVLPSMMSGMMASIGGAAGAMMAGIFGAMTTFTWISGGCWLALWLISIFWAFPIKRKIRKDRKDG